MTKQEVVIDLSPLYTVFGEPKWSATVILRRLLSAWGAKYKVVELKIPPGPYTETKTEEVSVSKRRKKKAVVVKLYDGHQTATALVFEPFIRSH
jgi:hypothetical protein